MIYMFMAGDRQAVKIGVAENIERRRGEVQVGNHLAISIYRTFEGDTEQEIILHRRFEHLHLRGEWFSWSSEFSGDVGLVEIVAVSVPHIAAQSAAAMILPEKTATRGVRLSEYLATRGMTYREFAAQCDRSVFQVHRWATGRRLPDIESAVAIERVTAGEVTPSDFVREDAA